MSIVHFRSVQSLSRVRLFATHGLQHARLPCLSPTPEACSNSCPLNRWCHPTISSSVVLFSSHLQSFPTSGSFLMSQFFESGGQRIGVSTSASVLPINIQEWFPLGWIGWISLQSKGLLQHHSSKALILQCSAFFIVQLSHPCMTTGKTTTLTRQTFVGKVGLKLRIQKTKIMASGPITSWQIDGETMETETLFSGLQNHCKWWLQPWN